MSRRPARHSKSRKRVQGKVSVDVGFQIRSAPPFVEIVNRIHSGALGKLASITGLLQRTRICGPREAGHVAR